MARIKTSTSKNSISYSIIEDYNRNGKRTTRVVEKIGNYNKIAPLANNEGIDVDTWLKNYLNNFLIKHGISNTDEKVIIEKHSNKLIPKNVTNKFNVGYLFLKDIYYSLKLNLIVKNIAKDYKFELN